MASAQLVVRDADPLHARNPADRIPYPNTNQFRCDTTVADVGARAVLGAIDQCPVTFFESREAYLRYVEHALVGIALPGASEAALVEIADKAKENAFFCITGALIDASSGSDADKTFMKALVAEIKEVHDRAELVGKLGQLKTTLAEKGGAKFLEDNQVRGFLVSLDQTLKERNEGLGVEGALVGAGQARNDTAESRARSATEAARSLVHDCRFEEAATALAAAQSRNLEHLAELRAQVSRAKKFAYCLERDTRKAPVNELMPSSPYLRHALDNAASDIAQAQRRDAEQTQLVGELADLEQSVRARRNDVDVLKQRAERNLQAARTAAASCDWAAADRALDTLNIETVDCALKLDAQRRARDEVVEQIRQLRDNLATVESEFGKALAQPFGEVESCGQFGVFADVLNQFKGQCRALVGIDAKIAALRERGRACGDAKIAARTSPPAPLTGTIFELVETKPDNAYAPWTVAANKVTYGTPGVYHGTYEWSAPPQQVGANGFQLTLTLNCEANQRMASGMKAVGGFTFTPVPDIPCNLGDKGGSGGGSVTVSAVPPQTASPGTMIELRIGAYWGLGTTYKYRAR